MKKYEFWFVVGSQFLYGPEVLKTVEQRAQEMAAELSKALPYPLVYKVTAKTNKEISDVVKEANYRDECAGIVTWCHTFSPSKMWINGLASLQKPYCHLATQYNKEIPNDEIDMDFMNLNQAAHGDREHGFIAARLRMPRKVIAGYWQDEKVHRRLGDWMKAAVGVAVSKEMKVMRFGDNMREVAVTEGDKVEAQIKLGWQVNTWAVGDLVKEMNAVPETEIDALTALGRRMDKQFGERCALDGEQMTGRVLDFTEQAFVTAPGIGAFVGECGMQALLAKMDFTRELVGLFRRLSPRLFGKETDRERLVGAAQEHLDGLVSLEEEAEQEKQEASA